MCLYGMGSQSFPFCLCLVLHSEVFTGPPTVLTTPESALIHVLYIGIAIAIYPVGLSFCQVRQYIGCTVGEGVGLP